MPIKPRSERGNKWLRYLFAAVLLAIVVGGGAFAIARFFDDGNDSGEPGQVVAATDETPTTEIAAQSDSVTEVTDDLAPTEPPVEPTATVEVEEEPTPVPSPTTQGVDQSGADDDTGEPVTVQSAASLLPSSDELPGSWTVSNEGERTKSEVGDQLGADGEELLSSWSWRENEFRDFALDSGADFPNDTSFLSVSVHRYASQQGASESLNFYADIVVSAQGVQEVAAPTIGEEARALAGPSDGANLYILYVRQGNYVIRLGGSSAVGDPSQFIDGVATDIVERI